MLCAKSGGTAEAKPFVLVMDERLLFLSKNFYYIRCFRVELGVNLLNVCKLCSVAQKYPD